MSRVFALGLDGIGPDVWTRLRERGWLPVLGGLFRHVVALASTIPPLTAPSWTSIATGLNPGRHGVLDFWTRPQPGLPRELIGNSTPRAFWEVASGQGFGVGIFNYPLSYPPRPVNGFWVSGMNTPRGVLDFATPPALAARLADFTPDVAAEIISRRDLRHSLDDRIALLQDLIALQGNHLAAGLIALRESSPRALALFVFALTTTDRFLHFFWDCVAKSDALAAEPPGALMDLARRFWVGLDEGVSRWLDVAAPDLVLLFSDHGFGSYPRQVFNTPVWLRSVDWSAGVYRQQQQPSPVQRAVAAVKDALQRSLPTGLWLRLRAQAPIKRKGASGLPFTAETLYGQVVGLTVAPGISPGMRPALIEAALTAARSSRDANDVRIFEWAETGAAVWPGKPDSYPDVVICLRNDLGAGDSATDPRLLFQAISERVGDHLPLGVFGASAPWLPDRADSLRVWDVGPIVMQCLGAAIPDDMDGVIPDWVPGERLFAMPSAISPFEPQGYSDEQSAEITGRLRMLGYVD